MTYYKIRFESVPEIVFAHGYSSDRYNVEIKVIPDIIEFAYIEHGDITGFFGCEARMVPASNIYCMIHDKPCRLKSDAKPHNHFTVGVTARFEARAMTAAELFASENDSPGNTLVFTDICPVGGDGTSADSIIKRLISMNTSSEHSARLQCTGVLFELFSELTRFAYSAAARETGGRKLMTGNMYCRRCAAYVLKHVDGQIYVNDIAKELGISYGYLSGLFRSETGMTVVEYINHVKISRVKELIISKNITFAEAGRNVGISDTKYLSRIFKKETGISERQYMKCSNNVSPAVVGNGAGSAGSVAVLIGPADTAQNQPSPPEGAKKTGRKT